MTYFDDNALQTSHSGVVNVSGQFSLSFEGLAPLNFVGAGGTLTVNNASDPTNTSLTVQDAGTPTDGVSQIIGDGGFETTTFSGYDNLVVQGLNPSGNAITLDSVDPNTPASPAGAQALTAVSLQGGAGGDTIAVRSLPATVSATLLGGGGSNQFQLDNPSHDLQSIAGPVIVSPAGDTGAASNSLQINDSGHAGSAHRADHRDHDRRHYRRCRLARHHLWRRQPDQPAQHLGRQRRKYVQYLKARSSGSTYNIDTGSSGDTVNVSSDAPTNSGNLSGIQGAINLNTGDGTDSLYISDLGGPASQLWSYEVGRRPNAGQRQQRRQYHLRRQFDLRPIGKLPAHRLVRRRQHVQRQQYHRNGQQYGQ